MNSMKTYILLTILILLGIAIAVGGYFLLRDSSTPSTNTVPTTFPISSTTAGTGSATTMTVSTSNGNQLSVNDFIHNNVTIADPANADTFYLAGGSGACKADGTCPTAGNTTEYSILYYPDDGSFAIGLAAEPLGEVRKKAEKNLQQKLGIPQSQMCALNYSVMTTTYISQQFGGTNLGFSFCPGAVALP